MKNNSQYINPDWDKISRYVSGEMPEEEKAEFETYLCENTGYKEIISATRSDLGSIDQFQNTKKTFNTNAAWLKLNARISNSKPAKKTSFLQFGKSIMQWAAVMLAVIAMGITGYLIYERTMSKEITVLANLDDRRKEIVLSDGSSITLNLGAKLAYPKKFRGDNRTVSLSGEAFFHIKKNTKKPFIIQTPKAEVKVLGTSFNIIASPQKTEVLVETGKVQLSKLDTSDENLILVKGDLGSLAKNHLAKTVNLNPNYLAWKTRKIIFDATPLSEVITVIEKTYHVKIKMLNKAREALYFTATFETEPLDILLESIGKSFNLTYEKDGSTIIFKKR